jgi:hypothetical protein
MMESKVAGATGSMEDLISISRVGDGNRRGSALEALRAFSDNCDRFITMSLRRAGPSRG